jgi:hypothetical protein
MCLSRNRRVNGPRYLAVRSLPFSSGGCNARACGCFVMCVLSPAAGVAAHSDVAPSGHGAYILGAWSQRRADAVWLWEPSGVDLGCSSKWGGARTLVARQQCRGR